MTKAHASATLALALALVAGCRATQDCPTGPGAFWVDAPYETEQDGWLEIEVRVYGTDPQGAAVWMEEDSPTEPAAFADDIQIQQSGRGTLGVEVTGPTGARLWDLHSITSDGCARVERYEVVVY